MRRAVFSLVALAALAVAAPAAQAQTNFFAVINGASERPNPVNSPGSGFANLVIVNPTTVFVNLSVSGLGAPIQPTGADGHIHVSVAGPDANGGVVVAAFGNPNFTGTITGGPGNTFTTIVGTYGNAGAVVTALQDGNALTVPYFNFHTTAFPGGEVRGNITTAPEPGTLALLVATGLPVLAAVRRRSRRAA